MGAGCELSGKCRFWTPLPLARPNGATTEPSAGERSVQGQSGARGPAPLGAGLTQEGTCDQGEGGVRAELSVPAEGGHKGASFVIARGAQTTQADDEVTPGGQVAGAVPGAGGAQIFAERDIAHVVDRCDGPVAGRCRRPRE